MIELVSESGDLRCRRGNTRTLVASPVEAWVRSELLDERLPRRMHPSVIRVLNHLRQQPLDARRASLAQLAQIARLSPSRFMHVFTKSIGIPLRPYLLWLRVQRAVRELAAGRTVTEAAHLAGFADAPHLTRTCRHMLGATPRELIRHAVRTRASERDQHP